MERVLLELADAVLGELEHLQMSETAKPPQLLRVTDPIVVQVPGISRVVMSEDTRVMESKCSRTNTQTIGTLTNKKTWEADGKATRTPAAD